jgi:hypothetical protein
MLATLVSLLLATDPTPTFCDGYRQGYLAAVCQGMGWLCPTAPREYPRCPQERGTPREGYVRGYEDGDATVRRKGLK